MSFSIQKGGVGFFQVLWLGRNSKTVGGSENVNERLPSSQERDNDPPPPLPPRRYRRKAMIRVTAVTSAGEEFPSSLIFLQKPK